ncbi:hypothetical protein [uncultured Mucilaginibacter sp.]|uniref:hypothetical protein n=1 Tax=uncultured Mucilaginibacter sp. TaxID=797541 RepID=UPI0025FBB003|nr:hypothetical protein [uncultured Mucilaginibacter sp.]
MKNLKLSIASVLVILSLFTASSAMAKLPPVDLSIAPVNLSVGAPTYGNATVGDVGTNVVSPYITGNTSQMANASGSSLNAGYVNGQYYNIFGLWFEYNNGTFTYAPNYPINSGLIFLMIAAIAIGIKVLLNQNKKLKPQFS